MGTALPFGRSKSKHSLVFLASLAPVVALWISFLRGAESTVWKWIDLGVASLALFLGWSILTSGLRSLLLRQRFTQDSLIAGAALAGFCLGFVYTAVATAGILPAHEQEAYRSIPLYAAAATILISRNFTRHLRDRRLRAAGKNAASAPAARFAVRPRYIFALAFVVTTSLTGPFIWEQSGLPGVVLLVMSLAAAFSPESCWVTHEVIKRHAQSYLPNDGDEIPLDKLAQVDTLLVEHSGILTTGEYQLGEVLCLDPSTYNAEILHLAAVAEYEFPTHPISRAILRKAQGGFTVPTVKYHEHFPGRGVGALYRGRELILGNIEWLREKGWPEDELQDIMEPVAELYRRGDTVLYLSLAGKVLGAISLSDRIHPDAGDFLHEVHDLGLQTAVLSGDSPETVRALLPESDAFQIFAGLHPTNRIELVRNLSLDGNVVALVAKKASAIRDEVRPVTSALFELRRPDGVSLQTEDDEKLCELDGDHLRETAKVLRLARRLVTTKRKNVLLLTAYHLLGLPALLTPAALLLAVGWLPIFGTLLGGLVSTLMVPSVSRLRWSLFHPSRLQWDHEERRSDPASARAEVETPVPQSVSVSQLRLLESKKEESTTR